MDTRKTVWEQQHYDDEIPNPEDDTPRDDETDAVHKAARHHHVPADEDVPNDCFSEKML